MCIAANPDGWQPEMLEKDEVVYGHKSRQLLLEDAVGEAHGHEIGVMVEHGVYDTVARSAARGKFVRAKWARLEKERVEITPGG